MTTQQPERFGTLARATAATPATLPRLSGLDHTRPFLRNRNRFIAETCERLGVDGFRARFLMREVLCLRGTEAVAMFYGRSGIARTSLWPIVAGKDARSIQRLEGEDHRRRKAMFIRLVMDPARLDALVTAFEKAWMATGAATVMGKATTALTQAGSEWLALDPRKTSPRAIAAVIRKGVADDSPLAIFRELPPNVAAVEVAGILRSLRSVAQCIDAAATALNDHPMWRDLFRSGNTDYLIDFCEEVRRISPVAPPVAAIAVEEVVWQHSVIHAGTRMLLDLHGTMQDPRLFPAPERFRPERMLDWQTQDDAFIPQGGGKTERSHRCPGEAATLALMASAVQMMCRRSN